MKRGEPPRRKLPLLPGKPPRRSALKPHRRIRDPRMQQFSEAVMLRSHGRCEARISPACNGRASEAHHVVPRGRGRGWPWLHDASRNGLACCIECHVPFVHGHPEISRPLCMLLSRPADDADPGPILGRIEAARAAGVDFG